MESFGTAATAPEGASGFDCDSPLTAVQAMQFAGAGFTWCARYLSRGEEAAHDLEAEEVRSIHACGMAVVPVQHVAVPPWTPSEGLGKVLGHEAGKNAQAIGCPSGVTLWVDLEGVGPGVVASHVIGFCNAWTDAVVALGYNAGVYVGASCGLSPGQLYRNLKLRRYWRSLSRSAPDVEVRGFQIVQSFGAQLGGVGYDRDVITRDKLGDLPVWWAP